MSDEKTVKVKPEKKAEKTKEPDKKAKKAREDFKKRYFEYYDDIKISDRQDW